MNIIPSIFLVGLSLLTTKIFCSLAKNTKLMDKPNERSLHHVPKVRGGGLIFISLFLCALPWLGSIYQVSLIEQSVLFISVFLIALISFCDDLYNLSAKPRFAVQCLIAGLISLTAKPESLNFVLFSISNPYLIIGLTFFITLWAINHFNFMDGLDGFCGSQALFLFFAYSLLFGMVGALFYHDLCLILIFGLIGFLVFNFPPAKLFMGDVGSATLGFISFYIALIAQQKYAIPLLYWFILNALFLFDATLTLLRRIQKKEKWFAAHRKHAYQRLKQYGLSTRLILLGQLLINLSFLMGVFLIKNKSLPPYWVLPILFLVLIISYLIIEKLYPMFRAE
ncbi:glycosyltransferase family 4 protein [Legionella sp. km772]|uniref:MraY family glycosyltransferase n=1 Tax=Legionella sp. km772 TaxID=2498111 RepID=UPI0018F38B67|nr:glycosyltransferase family 4 protein [Legionella sp. km772]